MTVPVIKLIYNEHPVLFSSDYQVNIHVMHLIDKAFRPEAQSDLLKPLNGKRQFSQLVVQQMLSAYLNISPDNLMIFTTQEGKHFLSPVVGSLQFNYSHSGDYLVLAVSSQLELGIDIEKIHDFPMLKNVLKRTSVETHTYFEENYDNHYQYVDSFFRYWTTNEALQKCVGLLMPDTFYPYSEILFEDGLVRYHGHELWYKRLELPEHYMMTVVVKF